jgi:hypothetical protein
VLDPHKRSPSAVRSELLNIVAGRMRGRGESSGTSNALVITTDVTTPEPTSLPQTDPRSPVHVTSSDSEDDSSQESDSYEAGYQTVVNRPGNSGDADGKAMRKVGRDGWAETGSPAPVDTVTTCASESGTHLPSSSPYSVEH